MSRYEFLFIYPYAVFAVFPSSVQKLLGFKERWSFVCLMNSLWELFLT